jgi:hypothetical protein
MTAAEIPDLQTLMRYICKSGFKHHVTINKGNTAAILAEAACLGAAYADRFQTYRRLYPTLKTLQGPGGGE